MATKSKSIKVTFHSLVQNNWTLKEDDSNKVQPFYGVDAILLFIKKMKITEKMFNLQGDKFCFLADVVTEFDDKKNQLFRGLFKSGRNEFRPNLINKRTGEERKNPKLIIESEIDKTHFLIKIDKTEKEVYIFFERNFHGITVQNFTNYLKYFLYKYIEVTGQKRNYSIFHYNIGVDNFLTALENFNRTTQAEVFFDKKLLGSEALKFSNRTVSLKKDIILTTKATKGESITEVAVDFYNLLQAKKSPVSRVRIKGVDNNKNEILLDTELLTQADFFKVDADSETGEANTAQIYTGLKNISNHF